MTEKKFRPVSRSDVKAVFVKATLFEKKNDTWRLKDGDENLFLNLLGAHYIYGFRTINVRFGDPNSPQFAQISERPMNEVAEQLLARGVELVDLDKEAAQKAQPQPRKIKPTVI